MEALNKETQRLLEAALAKSTHVTYNRGINNFEEFRDNLGLGRVWPSPTKHIVAYISHLSLDGKSPSTISTSTAAIAYVHKINGWVDPTDNFVVRKLKEGARRDNKSSDSRLPITVDILGGLTSSLINICTSSYEACLFKTAFLLAFFGFLRVGEFTTTSKKGNWDKILSLQDITIRNDLSAVEVHIRSSKTDQRGVGTTLQIGVVPNQGICPVASMSEYLRVRPDVEGPLFIHFGGHPLTRYQFSAILKKGIKANGLPPSDFSPHSFRIGAATSAAIGGVPLEHIMEMGRWESDAVKSYIRPLKVVSPESWGSV